ncbi:MAG: hypothetical protein ACOZF0_05460 [Thermodesulfobacteriota bacterium]
MPPKTRFSNEDIIAAAFAVLRESGWKEVSARSIAKALQSSTTPIYTYLKSMKNLESELIKESLLVMRKYQQEVETGDKLLNKGVGYILFAMKEKHLFRFINDEDRMALYVKHGEVIWYDDLNMLSEYPLMSSFTDKQRERFLFSNWIFSHGLASLINNSLHQYVRELKGEQEITAFLAEALLIHWEGIKAYYLGQQNQITGGPIR